MGTAQSQPPLVTPAAMSRVVRAHQQGRPLPWTMDRASAMPGTPTSSATGRPLPLRTNGVPLPRTDQSPGYAAQSPTKSTVTLSREDLAALRAAMVREAAGVAAWMDMNTEREV